MVSLLGIVVMVLGYMFQTWVLRLSYNRHILRQQYRPGPLGSELLVIIQAIRA